MTQFIDRRPDTIRQRNKNAVNRRLFIRRFKNQIKNAVSEAMGKRSITDINNGEKIKLPTKDISEPIFQHGPGGINESIFPKNYEFMKGDKIKRPPSNADSKVSNASNTGEGMDEFAFELSKNEFLDLFFDNLELPELIRKQIKKISTKDYQRGGFANEGLPTNINVVRSMKNALGRRIAVSSKDKENLAQKERLLENLIETLGEQHEKVSKLKSEIEKIKKKIQSVPFIDPFDLKYHTKIKQHKPTTQAVMFCLMDVSGSMDKTKKDIAKRFFILLYLFLNRNYDKIELIFIRHHTSAKQVGEDEFFYSRETGGTVVSSALELMKGIINEHYPSTDWNIYAAQASDGDNWNADSPRCQEILSEYIMPNIQYFAYVEIMPRHHQSLWHAYEQVNQEHANFSMQHINNLADIYPVFSSLFKGNKLMSKDYLSTGSDWSIHLIEQYEKEIAKVASSYHLDTYPNQIEIITSEQMMDAYAATGMPLSYNHWSFGKQLLTLEKNYRRGHMGLAYEIVINANPCISYLLEENTMAMQALVMAHACYGHNSFFKSNYLFKTWTNPDAIIDYFLFAKNYIADCVEKYGIENVEETLDSCHSLMNYGVDRYKHPSKLSLQKEQIRQHNRTEYLQSQINDLWRTLPKKDDDPSNSNFPNEPQENILYFIEKHAPLLEPWQREIVRIVRKISQYFYPQKQTQVMNEGWACFWHYTIMHDLYDKGLIPDEFIIELLHSHTNVIYQSPFDSPRYNSINPYALGYAMMQDIKRICQNPTEEDKHWFPDLAHSDWLTQLDFAMRNFKDESFIAQYLSPNLIREFKLFSVLDDPQNEMLEISHIHDENGYEAIRKALSNQYNLSYNEPNIQIYNVDIRGDRSLTLRHIQHEQKPLGPSTQEVLKHLYYLWGFTVRLESVDINGKLLDYFQSPAELPDEPVETANTVST